jgi:hypothetical protein
VDLDRAPQAKRLRSLWAAHTAQPFPAEGYEAEHVGDLVMVDADIAGVISSVLGSRQPPAIGHVQMLRDCIAELDRMRDEVPEPARPYFSRLREMAKLALLAAGHLR